MDAARMTVVILSCIAAGAADQLITYWLTRRR
jgi:hypothetical protein